MLKIFKILLRGISWILLFPVYFYKYAIQAIKIHGPFKGFWLATRRIVKCNPWGTHGYDPVPPKSKIDVKSWKG